MNEPSAFPTWPAMRPLPADGIAGLYADRALDRGADPRVLVSLARSRRWEEERLPAMASAFEEGFVVYDMPKVKHRRTRGSRRLLVAAAIAALLLPLGAIVAAAAPVPPGGGPGYRDGQGYDAEIELPEIGIEAIINPATLGLPFGGGSNDGRVTVNGREHRNEVDAEVYTSEESTITINGEVVESADRAPMMTPAMIPGVPRYPGL